MKMFRVLLVAGLFVTPMFASVHAVSRSAKAGYKVGKSVGKGAVKVGKFVFKTIV